MSPHPEERPQGRVSKGEGCRPPSSFETLAALAPHDEAEPRTTLAPQDEAFEMGALAIESAVKASLFARALLRMRRNNKHR
jgi:hypothetical protein